MQEPNVPKENPQEDDKPVVELTTDEILAVIGEGEMETTHGLMRYSSNYTFLVTMKQGEVCIPAIYKPRKGERPLWDFPEGTLYKRELASYLTSAALGWEIVPPTVARGGDHGVGSVQMFIDHDPDVTYFTFDERHRPQLERLCLFDVLVNNADRKGGHCLMDGEGHIWGIDHGITFNAEHKLRTVIWDYAGEPVPQPLLEGVKTLCVVLQDTSSRYSQRMNDLLNPREVEAFQRRIDKVLTTGKYPVPGPGPNYPWPAV